MAEVWEGHDEVLSRPVAVKVLQPHLAADGIFLERFRREAITAARLAHPGVVATFDAGADDGTAYIVMELVRGRTLRQVLSEEGRLSPRLAISVALQVSDALAHAHRAGLVHRDIKPANVLLVDDDSDPPRVKVTDFGIAKASQGLGADLTKTGMVLGTPKYLSPEQIDGREPDARADLYALGVVLYEMLTGAPPFAGSTDLATALAHLNEIPPAVSSRRPEVPAALDRLVGCLLSKDPDRRVPSAEALCRALAAIGTALVVPSPGPTRGRATSATATGTEGMGPPTDPLGATLGAARDRPPKRRRRSRVPGMVIGCVALAAVALAAVLLRGTGAAKSLSAGPPAPPGPAGGASAAPLTISDVKVFMVDDRPPDDPNGTRYTFDGNPTTYWHTDSGYTNAHFGNLYPGLGLAIHLDGTHVLHRLVVTSPTHGWAARTYVSNIAVPSGQPVRRWGSPTAHLGGINGDATFSLGGRSGQWVLLFLTYLGPSLQVRVSELSVS